MAMAIERAASRRWAKALERAAATEGTVEERTDQVQRSFRRELIAVGVTAGGTAAIPGIGTTSAIVLTASEVAVTATLTTEMILTVAAIHGNTNASLAERKAWALALFAFEDKAAENYWALGRELEERGVGQRPSTSVNRDRDQNSPLGGRSPSADLLNSRLTRYLIARYGATQSALIVGKLLPFGIGAVIGGTANHCLVGTIIDRASKFFTTVTPGPRSQPPPPAMPPPPRGLPRPPAALPGPPRLATRP